MKIKRVIAAVVGSAAAVGAVAGGIYGYKAYQDQKLVAEVQPDIERKKIELNTIENNLAMATHKLDSLKNAKPVDKTPPKINTEQMKKMPIFIIF